MGNGNRLNNPEKTMKSFEKSALDQLKKMDGEGRSREETTLNKQKQQQTTSSTEILLSRH